MAALTQLRRARGWWRRRAAWALSARGTSHEFLLRSGKDHRACVPQMDRAGLGASRVRRVIAGASRHPGRNRRQDSDRAARQARAALQLPAGKASLAERGETRAVSDGVWAGSATGK